MKKCPNCQQFFEDDNVFCFNDGTPLIPSFDASQNRLLISLEENPAMTEIPTQVVSHQAPPANIPIDNSRFLYLAIGGLGAIILAMGGFFVLRNVTEKNLAQVSNQTESSSTASISSTPSQSIEPTSTNPTKKIDKNVSKVNTNTNNPLPGGGSSDNSFSPSVNSARNNFRLTRNFNRTFSGTADNDGITMRLERSGSSLSGKVFSRKSVTEISVSGDIYDDGSFEMSEYSDIGAITGIYQGRINSDGTMSGTWTKPDGSKPRSFYMRSN